MSSGRIGKQSYPIDYTISTNSQTSSYTLALTDVNKTVEISSTSATTLTVPADGTINFPIGTQIDVLQSNTGVITITPAATVTVNSRGGALKTSGQWAIATLVKRSANTWLAFGGLTT